MPHFLQKKQLEHVVELLDNSDGLKEKDLLAGLNVSKNRLRQILKILQVHDFIYKENKLYWKTPKKWDYSCLHAEAITSMRKQEWQQMSEFAVNKSCYMQFVTEALNDKLAHPCGGCSNCVGSYFDEAVSDGCVEAAELFLRNEMALIEPRKKWADGKVIPICEQMQQGVALSNYGDAGFGRMVQHDKYKAGKFSSELITAAVELMRERCKLWQISAVAAVPSRRRPDLVPDFAKAIAGKLGLPYIDCLEKSVDTQEQKTMQNSMFQCRNAYDSFQVTMRVHGNILLVDDMVDSRWTLTACASKLLQAGAEKVYPFALANTGAQRGR